MGQCGCFVASLPSGKEGRDECSEGENKRRWCKDDSSGQWGARAMTNQLQGDTQLPPSRDPVQPGMTKTAPIIYRD